MIFKNNDFKNNVKKTMFLKILFPVFFSFLFIFFDVLFLFYYFCLVLCFGCLCFFVTKSFKTILKQSFLK